MGGVKNEWIEAKERGWSEIDDKYVCEECVHDTYLKQQVRAALEPEFLLRAPNAHLLFAQIVHI
jgi:hypothetical protein